MHPESGLRMAQLAINWKKKMSSQFVNMTSSSKFFEVVVFLLSSLVTDASFMSVS